MQYFKLVKRQIAIKALITIICAGVIITGCNNDDVYAVPPAQSENQYFFPETIDIEKGGEATFEIRKGAVLTGDIIYLEAAGNLKKCEVTSITENTFCLRIPLTLDSGNYDIRLKRGESQSKIIGKIKINIVSHVFKPEAGTTVYGTVSSAEGPLKDVVVSDGCETVTTNDYGEYQLKAAKESGFVFVSVPSGYEPLTDGVFPLNYKALTLEASKPENVSFTLRKVNQADCRLLILGDMHLANRAKGANASNADNTQFKSIASDINAYAKGSGKKVYGLTLGDMTWDLYWYDCAFGPADYRNFINSQLGGITLYHTPGNHDNDMNAAGQKGAKNPFVLSVAPPYYSFNISDVHVVVLDNIDCTAYAGGGDKNRKNAVDGKVYDPQLEWLAKDLSYIPKGSKVIATLHVPLYSDSAPNSFKIREYTRQLTDAFAGYDVQFFTGHTHRNYNVMPGDNGNGNNITEHNVGAVCGDWWWSGAKTPGCLLAPDGTPAGYGVCEISGSQIKYSYKCAGKNEDFQFRAYDMNKISFSAEDIVGGMPLNSNLQKEFNKMIADYTGTQKNEVLVNVWNWSSRWKIEASCNGNALSVTQVSAYDPLHIAANVLKRWTVASTSTPIGSTTCNHHFFKIKAPDADSDIVITVTDDFGRQYRETMKRPKVFSTEAYSINF